MHCRHRINHNRRTTSTPILTVLVKLPASISAWMLRTRFLHTRIHVRQSAYCLVREVRTDSIAIAGKLIDDPCSYSFSLDLTWSLQPATSEITLIEQNTSRYAKKCAWVNTHSKLDRRPPWRKSTNGTNLIDSNIYFGAETRATTHVRSISPGPCNHQCRKLHELNNRHRDMRNICPSQHAYSKLDCRPAYWTSTNGATLIDTNVYFQAAANRNMPYNIENLVLLVPESLCATGSISFADNWSTTIRLAAHLRYVWAGQSTIMFENVSNSKIRTRNISKQDHHGAYPSIASTSRWQCLL